MARTGAECALVRMYSIDPGVGQKSSYWLLGPLRCAFREFMEKVTPVLHLLPIQALDEPQVHHSPHLVAPCDRQIAMRSVESLP